MKEQEAKFISCECAKLNPGEHALLFESLNSIASRSIINVDGSVKSKVVRLRSI